jgi:RND family efflux transporter MFP subunit
MKKPWLKWALAALVLGLIVLGALRLVSGRKAEQAAAAAQTSQRPPNVLTLTPSDVALVQTRELAQGLPISGSLKAVNTALLKARVAGELQDLNVREGDTVQMGQIIARIDPTEYQARLNQAQQQAQATKAQVDIARRQFDNNRALVAQGFISGTALESSAAGLAGAEATYQAAQASADVAAKAISDTVLRAPLTGQVAQRLAQPGERVAIDGRVLEIVDLSRLELEATLSAAESLAVRVGQTAVLQIEGSAQPVNARVVRVNPSAVAGSRAVVVYLAVEPMPGLRQGLFAQGTLNLGRVSALSVALSAVRTDKPQPYVQWVQQQAVVHHNVQLGVRGELDGQAMVAIQGLPENATVLAGSVGAVREGSSVQLKQAGQ